MKIVKLLTLVGVLGALLALAGCGGTASQSGGGGGGGANTATTGKTGGTTGASFQCVQGSVTAVGSTALQPLVEAAGKQYQQKCPGATINVQGGGSFTGLTQVAGGGADIGNSDVFASEGKSKGVDPTQLVDHKVAVVGFAIVTNPDIKVKNLTKQQVKDIYTGKVTNWNQVGGPDEKITIINRPTSSGTRATFKKYALDGAEEAQGQALTQDSSGAVSQAVKQTKGAVAYLALSYVNSSEGSGLNVVDLDNVKPDPQNITTGKYPIWSYEHMYTKGQPSGLAKAFLDYMVSDEVQKGVLTQLGYIPAVDMKVQRSE